MATKTKKQGSDEETFDIDPGDVTNPDDENEEEESEEEDSGSEESDDGEEDGESEEGEDSDDQGDSDDEEDQDGEGEYEIVLEGDSELSEKEQKTQKFHDRMNARKQETEDAKEAEALAKAKLEEKDRELEHYKRLAKGDVETVEKEPNPEEYADGVYDPAYIKAINTFYANQAGSEALKNANKQIERSRVQHERQKAEESRKQETDSNYKKHYEFASDLDSKLKAKDYEKTEKVVLDIFSDAEVDYMVGVLSNSALVFYKLGKDSVKARYFKNLFQKNPGRASVELGAYESKIKTVKRKKNNSSDPVSSKRGDKFKTSKGFEGPPGATYK